MADVAAAEPAAVREHARRGALEGRSREVQPLAFRARRLEVGVARQEPAGDREDGERRLHDAREGKPVAGQALRCADGRPWPRDVKSRRRATASAVSPMGVEVAWASRGLCPRRGSRRRRGPAPWRGGALRPRGAEVGHAVAVRGLAPAGGPRDRCGPPRRAASAVSIKMATAPPAPDEPVARGVERPRCQPRVRLLREGAHGGERQ